MMSEAFIAVNHDTEEFVDPGNFFDELAPNPLPEESDAEPIRVLAATTHIDWLDGHSGWIIPYLVTETEDSVYNEQAQYGDLLGAWAGDSITLLGETAQTEQNIQTAYTDISERLYDEVVGCESEITPGAL